MLACILGRHRCRGRRAFRRGSLERSAWLGFLVALTLFVTGSGAVSAQPSVPRPPQPDTADARAGIKTVLLVGEATTWLQTPGPPYDVGIALKIKLKQAGFRVTFDAADPFDAVLEVLYHETPGREYRALEQGTNITCDLAFDHPTKGRLRSYHLEASTPWPEPHGSLYWEAVRGLEENPYYYFIGDLLLGYARQGDESAVVFSRVLQTAPLSPPKESGESSQDTARVVANAGARVNAIRELGRLRDPETEPTLWRLVDQGAPREQLAALAAIGEWGAPTSLERLRDVERSASDADLKAAAGAAIARILEASRPSP